MDTVSSWQQLTEPSSSNAFNVDWSNLQNSEFLKLVDDTPLDTFMQVLKGEKLLEKTPNTASWSLDDFRLQRSERKGIVGGQGVVIFVRRHGNAKSMAMKVSYHRHIQRRIDILQMRSQLHYTCQKRCPLISGLYGSFTTYNFFITIMPKARFRSLKWVMQQTNRLPLEYIKYYFVVVATAIMQIHKIGICHRDIKCDNVLVSNKGQPELADFDLAKEFTGSGDAYRTNHRPTTMVYYPPETKVRKGYVNDRKTDSWLLGFLLAELMICRRQHLHVKFGETTRSNWKFRACRECRMPHAPWAMEVLSLLLEKDPRLRPHAIDLKSVASISEELRWGATVAMPPPDLEPLLERRGGRS